MRILAATIVICATCFFNMPVGLAEMRTLQTKNSAGRTGSVYLPSGYDGQSAPLMVLFHGTGGNGQQIASQFSQVADRNGFVILAPDSRISPDGQFTWEVGGSPGYISEDLTHTQKCLDELKAMPKIAVDKTQVIAVGYSGGGSSAPYIASQLSLYSAFAVLHGGVIPGGLGPYRPRGWFSTGQSDSVRPIAEVQGDMQTVVGIFKPLEWRTFPGGHEISSAEQSALVLWWLGGSSRSSTSLAADQNAGTSDSSGTANAGTSNSSASTASGHGQDTGLFGAGSKTIQANLAGKGHAKNAAKTSGTANSATSTAATRTLAVGGSGANNTESVRALSGNSGEVVPGSATPISFEAK